MLTFWHVHETFLGELILLEVGLVELDAALEHLDELIWWVGFVIPKDIIVLWLSFLASLTSSDSSEVEDVVFAVVDHLVGNLHEEACHSLIGVVVSGNGVDHLDTVHESWKGLFDGVRISIVQRLDEFLKSLKILDVVFSLIESLSDSELDASPLGGGKINLVSWLSKLFRWILRGLSEDIVDGSAVLAPQLLRDSSEFPHPLFPVVELLSWISLFILLFSIGSFKSILDLFAPIVEDFLEIRDHLCIWSLATSMNVLDLIFPFWRIWIKSDVALETFQGLLELIGELVEERCELLLLLFLTDTPVCDFEMVDEWLVDLVDDRVERGDRVL